MIHPKTKVIDNFGGRLTRIINGDLNSGLAKQTTSFGYDPFSRPNNLTWFEQPVQIDSGATIITDLIIAARERLESDGLTYVYAVGHTARVYKIQVNKSSTHDPNYDTAVLLTTLTGSPTFKYGTSIEFYGTTERMFISTDTSILRLDFDGTNQTSVTLSGWVSSVPHQSQQFLGSIFYTNGPNIAQLDSTLAVTTGTKLSPGFPSNHIARDIDISPDGRYLIIITSRVVPPDITLATQDSAPLNSSESYIFNWNGSDIGPSSVNIVPSFGLTANETFADKTFLFGYDIAGSCLFNGLSKDRSFLFVKSPLPNAIGANGNLLGWSCPEYVNGFLQQSQFLYGSLDSEVPQGLWRQYRFAAQGSDTDVIQCPVNIIVSNLYFGASSNGYTANTVGVGKFYVSTLEITSGGTPHYKLYKFYATPLGTGTSMAGVYETQTQLFSQKIKPTELRFYFEPAVSGNSFTINLIGSDGNAISGGTKTFTPTVGQDMLQYNPAIVPTYALGLRITNAGSTNMTIHKIEVDTDSYGQ